MSSSQLTAHLVVETLRQDGIRARLCATPNHIWNNGDRYANMYLYGSVDTICDRIRGEVQRWLRWGWFPREIYVIPTPEIGGPIQVTFVGPV